MKWLLLGIFILLLLLFFGGMFENGSASPAPTAQPTNVPTTWTATIGPPPTVDTASPNIYEHLNNAIEDMERSTKFTQLEHINGASYQVVYVGYQLENGIPVTFQVNTRCECANNAQCCSPTHTLIITMQAMEKLYYDPSSILGQVPSTVTKMEVRCFDHASPSGSVSMPWEDVKSFLLGNLHGFQLWSKVTPVPAP